MYIFAAFLFSFIVGALTDEPEMVKEKECKSYAEYAMVLHSLKGYSMSEYMYAKSIAMKVMEKTDSMNYMCTRAAMAVYNGDKEKTYYCNQMVNKMMMKMKDDNSSYLMNDGEVNWDMAIEKGKHLLIDNGCGERKDVNSKALYLFLDGEDYMKSSEMEAMAKDMYSMKIKIIVIVKKPSDEAYNYLIKMVSDNGKVYKVDSLKDVAEDEMMIEKLVASLINHKTGRMTEMEVMPKCDAYESMYSALMMTSYEVSTYPGNCREDKMKYAMKMIMKQMQEMKTKVMAFKKTRMYLQKHVLGKSYAMADLIFERVNRCTMMIECKMPGWMKKLQMKMDTMKKEMFVMKGGWRQILSQAMKEDW